MKVSAVDIVRAFTSPSVPLLKERDDSIEAMVAFKNVKSKLKGWEMSSIFSDSSRDHLRVTVL